MEAKTGLGPVMGLGTALGSQSETGCLQVVLDILFYIKSLRQETTSIFLLVTNIHLRLTRSLLHETGACKSK